MMLSCIYLGYSDNTVLIPNLKFETKCGSKQRKDIYKGNFINTGYQREQRVGNTKPDDLDRALSITDAAATDMSRKLSEM